MSPGPWSTELIRWRGQAITRWAAAMDQAAANREGELAALQAEIQARRHESQLYSEQVAAQQAARGGSAAASRGTRKRRRRGVSPSPCARPGGMVSRVRGRP